jgi:hypothetical protein
MKATSGSSNHETLRKGSQPQSEAVREAKADKSCQKGALKAWQSSCGDNTKTQAREGTKS